MHELLLVSPPFGEKGQKSKGLPISPQVFDHLTGLTNQVLPDIEVELVDANKEISDPGQGGSHRLFRAYYPGSLSIPGGPPPARSGKQVLFGGIHVSALPANEAERHADAIVKLRVDNFTIHRMLSRLPQISRKGFPMSRTHLG
jgi:hypothetical protein